MKRIINKKDLILLGVIITVSVLALIIMISFMDDDADIAVITVNGEEYTRLPLDKDTELLIETPNGYNLVVIKDGRAYVKEADCPDRTCVKTGAATELRPAVCLPHRVVISIESEVE